MLVIAHRGANKEELENSCRAFELAVSVGAQRIELDVQMTRDLVPVVVHDDHLERVTGQVLRVSSLDYQELRQVRLTNGETIPSLEEVVEKFLGRIELNIEIKNASIAAAQKVGAILKNHPLRERVIISAFEPEPLVFLQEHYPFLKRACLIGDDKVCWPFFAYLAPNVFMAQCGSLTLHPRIDQVSRELIDQAKNRQWQVFAWAPMIGEEGDREMIWSTLKALGVDGLCTNYPRELKAWLAQEEDHEIN